MKRRRGVDDTESLDLLLDTITNAFGGIVFMALLLAVLVRAQEESAPQTSVTAADRLVSLERARAAEQLRAKIASAQSSLSELSESIQQIPMVTGQELNQLQDLERRREEARQRQAKLAVEQAQLHDQIAELVDSAEGLQQRAAQLKGSNQELEQRLDDEKAKRTITSDLPQEKETSKVAFGYLLRRGRLVSVYRRENGNIEINPELEACDEASADLVTSEGSFRVAADSGMRTDDQRAIQQLIESVNPQREHLALAVWEEEFNHFPEIRKRIVEAGIEYQLLVMSPNEKVSLGAGRGGRVQ